MVEIIVRALGAVILGGGGFWLGRVATEEKTDPAALALSSALLLLGVVLGAWGVPYLLLRPLKEAQRRFRSLSLLQLSLLTVGLLAGLIIAALLVPTLSVLPEPADWIASLVVAVVAVALGIGTMLSRQEEFAALWERRATSAGRYNSNGFAPKNLSSNQKLLVDTSAIIDGRIADISEAGFIQGTLVLPRFVLDELRHIADSPDGLRRNRGRRGLDVLNRLQKESPVPVEITDTDFEDIQDVDSKLVKLASLYGCPILTNDFNLNRVAELQGVSVLNINQLANAVKSVVLPGEEMTTRIIQEGKEIGQGVGFLDDGTMVVVEGGRRYLNEEIEIVVTRVLQTVAGRMIFAQPKGNG
jgi:uncharacterized protein YacL